VDVTVYGTSDLLNACAYVYDAVTQGQAAHAGHTELELAVLGAVKRPIGDRWAWGRRVSSNDVSMLEGATLAAWYVSLHPDSAVVWSMDGLDVCDRCGKDLDREIPEDEDDWLCQSCYDAGRPDAE
jgi:hypothetical protein